MNERIKQLRARFNLTQAQFAERLNLSRNYIAVIEIGQRDPSDRTIIDICREFGVNELWLREGIGEMFVQRTRRDELFDYARRILGGELTDVEASVLAVMADTTPEEWQIFAAKIRAIADGIDTKKEQADP